MKREPNPAIHALLREAGWTLADLEKMTGKRLNTLSRYATGTLETPRLMQIFLELMAEKKNRRIVEKYLHK